MSDRRGAAHDWYRRLIDGGWPAVENLVAEQQPETLHIDFKAKADPTKGPLDRDDRKNLAEALSGFANSDGGVLVWGLDARPGKDGVDRVQGFARVTELQGFRAAIEGEPADAISPPVAGLEFHAIEDPDQPGAGVVLCLVPASDDGPHMAIAAGQHRYYRRNGTSFLQMEHFEVADMFGRRAQPRLAVTLEWELSIRFRSEGGGRAEVRVHVAVANEGRGPARGVAVTLSEPVRPWGVSTPEETPFKTLPAPRGHLARIALPGDMLLFRGDSFRVATYRFAVTGANEPADFSIQARADCLGAPSVTQDLSVARKAIGDAASAEFSGQRKLRSYGWT